MEPVRGSANRSGESERGGGGEKERETAWKRAIKRGLPGGGTKKQKRRNNTETEKVVSDENEPSCGGRKAKKKKDRKNTVDEGRAKKVERRVSKARLNPRNRG